MITAHDFFSELIDEAQKDLKHVKLHPLSQSYLSELLVSFLPSEKLFGPESESKTKMVAELWLETQSKDTNAKIIKLKSLADMSLYVSGFFAPSFKRKLINQSYYIQIGEMAFKALSNSVNEKEFESVYQHFADFFQEYVDLLSEVSFKVNIQQSGDLLELFDRYVESGSEWAADQLLKEGVNIYPLKKNAN